MVLVLGLDISVFIFVVSSQAIKNKNISQGNLTRKFEVKLAKKLKVKNYKFTQEKNKYWNR